MPIVDLTERQEYQRRWAAARRTDRRAFLDTLVVEGCVDCGEQDRIVLQFHHRDPTIKMFDVGTGAARGRPHAALQAEADKCDVLCANCHVRRHSSR